MADLTEPTSSGPSGAARWSAYLDWLRADLSRTVLSLDPAEQRRSSVPSGWSPIEMLSHCLHMEQRWFVWGFLGEDVEQPWGDWSVPEPWTSDDSDEVRPGARWVVPEDVTAESLVSRLDGVGARTREVLAARGLGETALAGGRFDDGVLPDLEWICFHVVTEYARHLGQLDVALEVAGATPSDGN
jgi:uncharacterized damage-inducible protein DinB